MDKMVKSEGYMSMERMPRAWLYCRTAGPNAFALEQQKKGLSAYAEKNLYEVMGITAEHGNGNTMSRPGLAEITDVVRQGKIDILLIHNAARLGRNAGDVLRFVDWLAEHDVEVVCVQGDFPIKETKPLLRVMRELQESLAQ